MAVPRGLDARTFSLQATKDSKSFDRHASRLVAALRIELGEPDAAADVVWGHIGLERLALAIYGFGVPFTGSFATFASAAFLYVITTTAFGLVISAFMNSQIAAIFATTLLTMIPATQFSGMIDPVSSLQGAGAIIGRIYPTAHFVTITRGTFSKALAFGDLTNEFVALAVTIPVLLGLGAALLKKQGR